MTKLVTSQRSTSRLDEKLQKLKYIFGSGDSLRICWKPGENRFNDDGKSALAGEILGNTIYLYDEDEEEALNTLKHEFIDFVVSTELLSAPKLVINKLLKAVQDMMYERKEIVVEKIVKILP